MQRSNQLFCSGIAVQTDGQFDAEKMKGEMDKLPDHELRNLLLESLKEMNYLKKG